jgi:hypothetical protein
MLTLSLGKDMEAKVKSKKVLNGTDNPFTYRFGSPPASVSIQYGVVVFNLMLIGLLE